MKYIGLQYCRALASLLVVFYHFSGYHLANQGFDPFYRFFKFGHLGVDFFFVLSGFVIMMAHAKDIGDRSKIKIFCFKRLIRIFPTYWIHFILILSIRVLAGIILKNESFYKDFSTGFLVENFLLLMTPKYLIGPAWSLTYELFFYLLFMLGMLLPRRVFFIGLVLYSLALIFQINVSFSFLPHHLIEFFMGMITFSLLQKFKLSSRVALSFFFLGLTVIFGGWLYSFFGSLEVLNSQNAFVLGLPMVFLIWGLCSFERSSGIKESKFLLALGEASFVLYISHMIFQTLAHQIYQRMSFTPVKVSLVYLGLLIFCILYSLAYSRFIEEPMLKNLRHFFLSKRI